MPPACRNAFRLFNRFHSDPDAPHRPHDDLFAKQDLGLLERIDRAFRKEDEAIARLIAESGALAREAEQLEAVGGEVGLGIVLQQLLRGPLRGRAGEIVEEDETAQSAVLFAEGRGEEWGSPGDLARLALRLWRNRRRDGRGGLRGC